jgi:hypothetical protein
MASKRGIRRKACAGLAWKRDVEEIIEGDEFGSIVIEEITVEPSKNGKNLLTSFESETEHEINFWRKP